MKRPGDTVIDSPHNALIKRARALEKDTRRRHEEGLHVVWGLHLAREALRSGVPIAHAVAGPGLEDGREGRAVLADLRERRVPLARTTARVLESIAAGSGDQDVLLLVAQPERDPADVLREPTSLIVAAHGVQDPGNLGSIVRTALAFGAEGLVVLPGCADPYGSRAARAAMGAHFFLPIARAEETRFVTLAREAGLRIVAADPAHGASPPDVDLRAPIVLLVGNEGAGLPATLLRESRDRVRLPMSSRVESLNVHAAAAALLYETARQRGFPAAR